MPVNQPIRPYEVHVDNYFDLGGYSRPITTQSAEAQAWFDRGLIWCYGFHRTEAVRCFQKAVASDPECAMAYWGLAYSIGPYYNISWLQMAPSARAKALAQTYEHARQAQRLAAHGAPIEKALCDAFTVRYAAPHLEFTWLRRMLPSLRADRGSGSH